MRHAFPITALLSLLLAACASAPTFVPARAVDQSGSLKVHPGLVGQAVPPELRPLDAPASASASAPAPATSAVEKGASGQAADQRADGTGLQPEPSIYFDLNSAELKAEASRILQDHAAYLAKNPKARIRVEGNADERGPSDHNRKLGLKRADQVKQFLLLQGAVDKQVKVVTLGASNPKRKGHDEESWAENRRADLVYDTK